MRFRRISHGTPISDRYTAKHGSTQWITCPDISGTALEDNDRSSRLYNRRQPGGQTRVQLERDKSREAGEGDSQKIEIVPQYE